MARGEKVGRGPIHLRAASVRIPLSAVILGWLGRFLGRALMRVLSQPVLWAALTVYGVGYWLAVTVGPWPFLIAALAVTFTLVAGGRLTEPRSSAGSHGRCVPPGAGHWCTAEAGSPRW